MPNRTSRSDQNPKWAFARELQTRFGWRAGKFIRIGRRASYPLKLTRATETTATRTVLIGNAAQALHPVAGQGFNLGLRDAAMLAEVIANASGDDVGTPELLRRFAQWRAADRGGVVGFTDGLVKLFGSSRPGVGILRNLGLLMFDLAPPAKSALARVSAGFGGPTPRLARGLGVRERGGGPTAARAHGVGAERGDVAVSGREDARSSAGALAQVQARDLGGAKDGVSEAARDSSADPS